MDRREFLAGAAGLTAVTVSGGSTAIPAAVQLDPKRVAVKWVSNPHSDCPQREKPAPA